jgi:uncharacterized protein
LRSRPRRLYWGTDLGMIFYLILTAILLADLWWCVLAWSQLKRGPRWPNVVSLLFGLAQISGILVILFSRGGMQDLSEALPRWAHGAVFVWHLLFLPGWLVYRIAKAIVLLGRMIAQVPPRSEPARDEPAFSRRQFIGAAAAITPPLFSIGAAVVGEGQLDHFRVRKITVPLADLPPALDGLTIAHVTDVHIGRFTRGKVIERIVEETNRLEADLVAMTGDLINDSLRALPAALEMARALRGKHGVVTCEGNHDLIEDRTIFYREAERGGLPLLRNETASLTIRGQRVQVLGLPWMRDPAGLRDSMKELLTKRDPNAWGLLLAHHPHAWDNAEGIPLTLAGHTHGGQIMLNEHTGFGPWMYRYWSGLYTPETKERALVVSNGVGNWFPVRVNAPAEIVHLTLRAVPAQPKSTAERSRIIRVA